jgi:cytochrome c-type biogenesis protein CcmF
MSVGDTVAIGGYAFRFDGTTPVAGPNYRAARGTIDVSRGGEHFATLHPEKRTYNVGGQPMTEAAIRNMPTGDLYVSLGEPVADVRGACGSTTSRSSRGSGRAVC